MMELIDFEIINKKMRVKVKNKAEFLSFAQILNDEIKNLQSKTNITSLMELLILNNINNIEQIINFKKNNSDEFINELKEKNIILESKFSALEIVYQNELEELRCENQKLNSRDFAKENNENLKLIENLKYEIETLRSNLSNKNIENINNIEKYNTAKDEIKNLKLGMENFEIDMAKKDNLITTMEAQIVKEKNNLNSIVAQKQAEFDLERKNFLSKIEKLEQEINNFDTSGANDTIDTPNNDAKIDDLLDDLNDDFAFLDDIDITDLNEKHANGECVVMSDNNQNNKFDSELEIIHLRLEYIKKQIKLFLEFYKN